MSLASWILCARLLVRVRRPATRTTKMFLLMLLVFPHWLRATLLWGNTYLLQLYF